MLIFQHVEDYLEYLAGYEVGINSIFMPQQVGRISLARYDVQIVNSMSSHTLMGGALTDRQAELVLKLITKYRRQFAKLGIEILIDQTPKFRLPIRKIDRMKLVWLDGEKIGVRFPYDGVLIKEIQTYRDKSQGTVHYDRDSKIWHLGMTEQNLNWAVAWGEVMGFEIANEIRDLFMLIIKCEQTPYAIKLIREGNVYTITNAAPSLIEYIETNCGGFDLDNTTRLIDLSGSLGYEIDDSILADAAAPLRYISTRHSVHLQPSDDNLDMIYDYAEITDRYPICIYNPTLIDLDLSRFHEEEIVRFDRNGKTKTSDYDPYGVKVVYAQKIPATWDFPVPLMVSTFEMMYGGKKMDWTQCAEKIIYYTETKLRND